jgi:hypothetical protein
MRNRLDQWQTSLVKQMVHCPPTISHSCLQQELGFTPLHMACDLWTLTYWHHLRTLKADRLLYQMYTAWSGRYNPWQANVNKLLQEYKINADATRMYPPHKFKQYARTAVMDKLLDLWKTSAGRQQGGVAHRYQQTYGQGPVITGMNGIHPVARTYFSRLTHASRGWAGQLVLQLRTETLPLRCMHSKLRRNETLVAQNNREKCPVCKQAPETVDHFLLHCPGYTAQRQNMMLHLTVSSPQTVDALAAGQWSMLLTDDILGAYPSNTIAATAPSAAAAVQPGAAAALSAAAARVEGADMTSMAGAAAKAVVDFVAAAWKVRSTALTGRETNGGDAMV